MFSSLDINHPTNETERWRAISHPKLTTETRPSTVVPMMAATTTRWEAPIFYRRLAASIGEEVVGFKHESNI
jgi:hypothetical protein